MRLFSSRKKRPKQTSLTPRRLSSPWRTFKPRLEQLEERTLLNAGALDSAFGIGGKVTTHFGGFDNGRELAIQPDGKIVVVGSEVVNGVSDFGLARYNSDGSLDSTFGTGGEVTTFGRGDWWQVPRRQSSDVLQVLYQMNDNQINFRTFGSRNVTTNVTRVMEAGLSDTDAVNSLFLSTLGRYATDKEYTLLRSKKTTNYEQWLSDIQWALLNKVDFVFSY